MADDPNDIFSGEIDPEIANLLGTPATPPGQANPNFFDLFQEERPAEEKEQADLTKEAFLPIKRFKEEPKPYFHDKNFYKIILTGEGEPSKVMHAHLSRYLSTEDKEEKAQSRSRITSSYWDIAQSIAAKIGSDIPLPKKLFLRYGLLLPSLISNDQREHLASVIENNETGEPIHYIDEWLEKVGRGTVNPLATDEVAPTKRTEKSKVSGQLDKVSGQKQARMALLQSKLAERDQREANMDNSMKMVKHHNRHRLFTNLNDAYGASQRQALSEINENIRKVLNLDKEIGRLFIELEKIENELKDLQQKAGEAGITNTVDAQATITEMNSLRQLHKLCAGRQGNHLPLLMKNFFFERFEEYGIRENVLAEMAGVEKLDPGLFKRTFRQQTNRIVPHVILIPSYGSRGICWEPFERFNRSTSRGRIGIPMFPRDLKTAVIAALGDLRWQVAKEKAQHYWMEEGLTGWYYQRFEERRLRGDVRLQFIDDYILWITKESQGTQKLDKEVRAIFWRYMPFPEEIRNILRKRGYVYNELYKKDMNRLSSDGY